MAPVVVLLAAWLVLRVVGGRVHPWLDRWETSGRAALAITFAFTGASHFTFMREDFLAMLPEPLSAYPWIVDLTGAAQILGAICLLIPATRPMAASLLAILLIAMFPANVRAALDGIPFAGRPPLPLPLRAATQAILLASVWWTSIKFHHH